MTETNTFILHTDLQIRIHNCKFWILDGLIWLCFKILSNQNDPLFLSRYEV